MRRALLGALLALGALTTALLASPVAEAVSLPNDLPDMDSSAVHLTVSGGTMNETGGNLLYAPDVWIKVYSPAKANRTLTFAFDSGTCDGTKSFTVFSTYSSTESSDPGSARSAGSLGPCSGTKTVTVQAGDFPSAQSAIHPGYYVALVRVHMNVSEPTLDGPISTFRVTASNPSVGLGYWGLYERGNPSSVTSPGVLDTQNDRENVTAFLGRPSSGATDTYKLRFKAPCDFITGSSRDIYLKWFDDDQGTSYQPAAGMEMYVGETDQGNAANPATASLTSDGQVVDGWTFRKISAANFTGGGNGGQVQITIKPLMKYIWVWKGITRQNGIAIYPPFDSANVSFPCGGGGGGPTWELDNVTTVNPGIGGYTDAASDTTAANNAKAAYRNARFQHIVYNKSDSPSTAASGDHKSYIQYRLKRGNSNTWRNSQNGDNGSGSNDGWARKRGDWTGNLAAGQSSQLGDSDYSPQSGPRRKVDANTSPHDLQCLLHSNGSPGQCGGSVRHPVYKGMPCTSGTNCVDTDPGPAVVLRYSQGDRYCERVVTYDFTTMTNGIGANGSTSTEGHSANASGQRCIELGATTAVDCQDWQINGISSVDGPSDPAAAWVGDSFVFAYDFWKTGHAPTTPTIYFWLNTDGFGNPGYAPTLGPPINPTPTHSQAFGDAHWTPTYDYGPVGPAQGGQTITYDMHYTPVRSAGVDNCGMADGDILTDSINVPFYYHMTQVATVTGGATIAQGDPIDVSATVTLPTTDDGPGLLTSDNESGGRPHTYSQATNWRIVEFRTSSPVDAKNAVPQNSQGDSGPCADLPALGVPGFSGCNDAAASGTESFALGTSTRPDGTSIPMTYTRPGSIDPVGTNFCFVAAINRPTHNATAAWRYSIPQCKTVVKGPKVQFFNGGITVGRRPIETGICGGTAYPTAGIQTTRAPAGTALGLAGANPAEHYLYGSWIEYGAFAPGLITNFGTTADQTNLLEMKRLAFTNVDATQLGRYDYTAKCLSNFFKAIDYPDNATDITASAGNVQMTTSFPNPADDKTGYVAHGADITINPPASDGSYNGFNGRDIVVYAKRTGGSCTAASGGNITIKTNISYKRIGYTDIRQLPRIVLMADCNITIDDSVARIDAALVAGDAVKTCNAVAVRNNICNTRLTINGLVQAQRLLLWRTAGADLTNIIDAKMPAETFMLPPDQLIVSHARGTTQATPREVYRIDLPPRY